MLGVTKSLKIIDSSDLVIFILNNNEELSDEEKELLNKLKDKKKIIVVNKIDLEGKLDKSLLGDYIEISVKEIKRLVKELQNSINLSIELSDEGKNSEVSFLREALVFRNLGLEDIEKESISRKEEER